MELAALSGTGDNFAAVLYGMKNEDDGSYRRLLSLVQEVDPSVEYFNCIHLRDGRIVVEVKHKGVAETGPLAALSDGTLLYMALCMVALQPTLRTRRTVTPPSLVLFEEPENGLYVRRLHQLFDRLKEMSERTQTIITTHSPFLLDFFDDAVEDIFVLRNGENGTEIKQANPAKVDQLLETMSMGEMLYRELLTCE
jgi:predicted ATPase